MRFLPIFLLFCCFSLSSFSQDNESEESVSFVVIEKVPIYPGCKGNNLELKDCFSKSIQRLFSQNFNMGLANKLLPSGKHKIFIGFKIDRQGDVVNIMARAPHLKIKQEVIRVMNLIPKMIAGELKGEKVGVKYSIPFTIKVTETQKQKRERKRRELENRGS